MQRSENRGVPQLPFHPAVAAWLERRFGGPTDVQSQAWAVTSQRRHALIAAPTGSGKTLAAFLAAIDELVREGLSLGLTDEVHVLYVSPLKALSNDIRKNLQEPLEGIAAELAARGLPDIGMRSAVRTIARIGGASNPSFMSSAEIPASGASRLRWMSFDSAFSGDT